MKNDKKEEKNENDDKRSYWIGVPSFWRIQHAIMPMIKATQYKWGESLELHMQKSKCLN